MDARATQGAGSAERGLGRHVVEILRAINSIAPDTLGSVRLDPRMPAPDALGWLEGTGRLAFGLDHPKPGEPVPSIYHIPSPFESEGINRMWPRWLRSGRDPVRTVVTLHDLIPLVMSDLYMKDSPAFRLFYTARLGLVRYAHQVLAISDSTAADAVDHLGVDPGRITLIESGISDAFSSLVGSAEEAGAILEDSYPKVRDGFLLYVGGGDPRKNMTGTIEAFARIPERLRHEHQLVIVSRLGPQVTRELRVYSRRLGIDERDLFFAGFVPDRELAAMYRRCALFVFPSLYEGFGLPVLEAMSCGAPVAAGNTSSIPEVLGDLDATFDPADPDDIARTVAQILEHPERLDALRERSKRRVAYYTWEKTAKKVLAGYEHALAGPVGRPSRKTRRGRVALVTPWSPERSHPAASSERLVDALSEHVDVDVAVAGAESVERSRNSTVRFFTADELDWLRELRSEDRRIYVLDGSPRRAPVLEALTRDPGAVLLHDVRLTPLYKALADESHWEDRHWLEKVLAKHYGDEAPSGGLGRIEDPSALADRGMYLTQEVQERAERLVVHSRHQLDVLRREQPAGAAPPLHIPAPIPIPPPIANGAEHPGSPLVVSTGRLEIGRKRLEPLLRAFAELAARRAAARLALLGDAPPAERRAVARLCSELGIADAVDVRGRVGESEYWGTLSAADLAVQLRDGPDGGVVSGAVCDAIAVRTPVIVSATGWFQELPDPVVSQLPVDASAEELAARMDTLGGDERPAADAKNAQDEYAEANTYAGFARRLAELLEL